MTTCSQLRNEHCATCGEQSLHGPSGCMTCQKAGKPPVISAEQKTIAKMRLDGLQPRERQVFYLLAQGVSVAEIAARMGISTVTANIVRTRVASKLYIVIKRRDRDNSAFRQYAETNNIYLSEAAI